MSYNNLVSAASDIWDLLGIGVMSIWWMTCFTVSCCTYVDLPSLIWFIGMKCCICIQLQYVDYWRCQE